jgi:peptide/nickel transport system permease protein
VVIPLKLFVHGDEYDLWGFIPLDLHLFGAEGENQVFLFGSDNLGRDIFSRSVLRR